ncbi:uncharacterized protein JN550_012512 [Neoarthrinium moseri]|uniref:uncharacterized protein n=1 Tax=Neoarthrinium moseri TaxID=1658444 RepID=UPI001FDB3D85|nr:uncharacterized protein JN550_012512 [Neoarthrinium moseri]KAI1858762.1 hypothetical protein JN550_012512 [Neoarthrinium moseri]
MLPAVALVSSLFAVYYLDSAPIRYPGDGPIAEGFNFLQGMFLSFGTPFLAWNAAANSRGMLQYLAIAVASTPSLVFFTLANSQPTVGLLWGSLGFWWALGLFTTKSQDLQAGLQWLGRAVLMKIVEASSKSAAQIAN